MLSRQPDGTWRGPTQPVVLPATTLRARWIEAEVIHLKKMGFSFERIAEHITRVGRGQAQSMAAQSDGMTFPSDFSITRQACHKAFKKALVREPALKVAEMRKLDTARCEDYIMYLQPSIVKGDDRSMLTAIKVLNHKARINGYLQSKEELIQQKEKEEQQREMSKAEFEAEMARQADLYFNALKILVELGTPLHQILGTAPPPIETVAVKLIANQTNDDTE